MKKIIGIFVMNRVRYYCFRLIFDDFELKRIPDRNMF